MLVTMRTKIVLRNLYISQALIFIFLIFAYWVWFPHSFSDLGGFYKTALMLIFVDLILGPLLVFIVFKEGKKYLAFDINVLLSIQIVAFVFGAYSLFLKHPAYIVFAGDRFTLTNVSEIYPPQPLQKMLKQHFFSTPISVVAKNPSESIKRQALLFDVLLKNAPDIDKRPQYFVPLANNTKKIMAKSLNPNSLFSSAADKKKLQDFIEKYSGKPSDYAFFPLSGNNKKDVIWVFKRATAMPVGIIDSDPWKARTALSLSANNDF